MEEGKWGGEGRETNFKSGKGHQLVRSQGAPKSPLEQNSPSITQRLAKNKLNLFPPAASFEHPNAAQPSAATQQEGASAVPQCLRVVSLPCVCLGLFYGFCFLSRTVMADGIPDGQAGGGGFFS